VKLDSYSQGADYFHFEDVGSGWVASKTDLTPISFEFTLTTQGILIVTDAYYAGDQFEVFNYGTSLGTTSPVLPDSTINEPDPDRASADPRWSSAFFILDPGSYSITGISLVSPFGKGGAYLQVDPPIVPIPSSLLLLGSGIFALAGWRRSRKN